MSPPKLGYVLRMFPQTSETFIANEILELEKLGLPIEVYSYRRPRETVSHECVRLIQAPVRYLPDPLYRHPRALLQANRVLSRLEPDRYRRTVRYVLARSLRAFNLDVWRRFLQAVYLASLLKDSDIAHLHAHFAHRVTQVAMLASMLTGIPFSFSAHAKDVYAAKPADLREKIRAAQFVVTCTGANHEYLQQLVEAEERTKIKLTYHGVDLNKFRVQQRLPTETPLILSVGRLVEKKGFSHLLLACRILKSKGHRFRCLIAGEGPERRALERMVNKLALRDTVELSGSVSQEAILDFYRQATVFVLPCQVLRNGDRDGIPNVLVEAMAVGLPVVSTGISGIPELITSGHDGLLVPERNAQALASVLEVVLRDEALRNELRERARFTVAEKFDSRVNAQRVAALFSREPLPTEQPETVAALGP
ncbi:MAG: glycosyltransferase family 4 protein [Candidatus Rokubacteria bacterium]|nr:glycosyltransferase family 4 protein [Candidatus Rokubacteria bacterium]